MKYVTSLARGQGVNHTMYTPVLHAVLAFQDPVRFGNRVYAQVILMLSLVHNASFQKVVGASDTKRTAK